MTGERHNLTAANFVLLALFVAFFAAFLIYPVVFVVHKAVGGVTYAVTERTLQALRRGGVPAAALDKLARLRGRRFHRRSELRRAAASALGRPLDDRLAALLDQRAERAWRPHLSYFALMFRDPIIGRCIWNSLAIAVSVTLLTTALSAPLALLLTRYRLPFRGLLCSLVLAPMIMPPFVGAIGMRQIFALHGSVNLLLLRLGLIRAPIDWLGGTGFWGVVALEVLHLYPIMYLNVAAALANVDPAMEEAAQNLGGGAWSVFRRVTFPLMLPGFFAGAIIVFIWAFTDLGAPLILNYYNVVPVQIFNKVGEIHENPMGHALVVLVLAITVAAFLLSKRVVAGREYAMMSKGSTAAALRPIGPAAAAFGVAFVLLVVALALAPHLSVAVTSLAQRWSMTILPERYTFKYYRFALTHKLAGASVRNSLFLSVMATYVDVLVGVAIAYLLARKTFPGADALDALAMLPLALPGIVLAFGYVGCFSGTRLDPRVNPVPLLIISYAVRRLPYMVRAAYAGFQQTAAVLEEASLNLGAGPITTICRITAPLVFANVIAGGILTFSFAMLEVSDSMILAFEERYYPMTKAIYHLFMRIDDGPYIASAMGVLGMLLLMTSLFAAARVLGQRMGQLFRA